MEKRKFYTEWAYVLGLVLLAMGAALEAKADFGMSMIVAPAYILHLKLSETLPFFTFGMAEYCFQAALLVLLCLVLRRVRLHYLYCFATAVIYGFLLDGCVALTGSLPALGVPVRIALFLLGTFLSSAGVAMVFHTYLPPEAYEMFVKECADRFHLPIAKFKTAYDAASLLLGVILSFSFFGMWVWKGVNIGTAVCTLYNGALIGFLSRRMEARFQFTDRFTWRGFFEK